MADQAEADGHILHSKAKSRKDQSLNDHKDEIYQVYVDQDKSLQETIFIIEGKHGFMAKERKWKMKLKEWGMNKNLPVSQMRFIVEKGGKRLREEGKETSFFYHGVEVSGERVERFKKRKGFISNCDKLSPIPDTPAAISYHTPAPEPVDDVPDGTTPNLSLVTDEHLGTFRTASPEDTDLIQTPPKVGGEVLAMHQLNLQEEPTAISGLGDGNLNTQKEKENNIFHILPKETPAIERWLTIATEDDILQIRLNRKAGGRELLSLSEPETTSGLILADGGFSVDLQNRFILGDAPPLVQRFITQLEIELELCQAPCTCYTKHPPLSERLGAELPGILPNWATLQTFYSEEEAVAFCKNFIHLYKDESNLGNAVRLQRAGTIAALFERHNLYAEAELLYQKAINVSQAACLPKCARNFQLRISDMLWKLNQEEKSILCLCEVFCSLLQIEVVCHPTRAFLRMLLKLYHACRRFSKGSVFWDNFVHSVGELYVNFPHSHYTRHEDHSDSCARSWHLIIELAYACCDLGTNKNPESLVWLQCADIAFVSTEKYLQNLEDNSWFPQLELYIAYSRLNIKHSNWGSAIQNLLGAYNGLSRMSSSGKRGSLHDHTNWLHFCWVNLLLLLRALPDVMSEGNIQDGMKKVAAMDKAASARLKNSQQQKIPRVIGERAGQGLMEDGHGDDDADTTSSPKYGLTYTESTITGISYSNLFKA